MNRLIQSQVENNTGSSDAWSAFATHRQRMSELIAGQAAAGDASRLCILGAGNCNDIDLPHLLGSYREIHLVDLDAAALEAGVARQGLAGNGALRLYGGVDLTGQIEAMEAWSSQDEQAAIDVEEVVSRPVAHVAGLLPGPFDVVVSACVLSQLIEAVVASIGAEHPRFLECLQAVRLGHLRLLSALTAPGGTAVLVTDIVSSDTLPELATVSDAQLPPLLVEAVHAQNFFHGVNPAIVAMLFRSDPVLSDELSPPALLTPWRWDLGPRIYAVWGLVTRKR